MIYFNPKKILSTQRRDITYFQNYTHFSFDYEILPPDTIPSFSPSLTHLTAKIFHKNFLPLPATLLHLSIIVGPKEETESVLNRLPSSLTSLSISSPPYSVNYKIPSLPSTLSHIRLNNIDSELPYPFPPSLQSLYLSKWADLPSLQFPPNLTKLTFVNSFNSPVDHLPPTLKYLTFGSEFNHPVTNLPNYLKYLTFGSRFDQPINNLPRSITHLTLGQWFNNNINSLPSSISHLFIDGICFNQPLDHLPKNLLSLIIVSQAFSHTIENLPPSLINLELFLGVCRKSKYLSSTGYCYSSDPLHPLRSQPISFIPPSLLSLIMFSILNSPLPPLPTNLTELVLGNAFNQPLPNLPNNLQTLILGGVFDQPLPLLPSSLIELVIRNHCYSHSISITPILTILYIGRPLVLPSFEGKKDFMELIPGYGGTWSANGEILKRRITTL